MEGLQLHWHEVHEVGLGAWEWLNLVALLVAVILLLAGIGLLVYSRRSPGSLFLGLTMVMWGIGGVSYNTGLILWGLDITGWAASYFVTRLSWILMLGTAIAFAIVYPRRALERSHIAWLVVTAVVTGILLVAAVVFESTGRGRSEVSAFLDVSSFAVGLLVLLVILGWRWLVSPPGEGRIQIAWGMIPFMFWAILDGTVFFLYPVVFGGEFVVDLYAGLYSVITRVILAATLGWVILIAGIAFYRVYRRTPSLDERAVAFLTLYLFAVSFLPLFMPPTVQFMVWLLLTNAFGLLVIYAVARYNIVALDLKIKWTMKKGTVAAAFVAAFFVASEVAKLLFEGVAGSALIGILAAGLLIFAIAPLQRTAQRLADVTMPRVVDSPDYREERQSRIYRAQVDTLLADGQLSAKERQALLRLQRDLGLPAERANRIEEEALEALGGLGPDGASLLRSD